jgi:uncharacterized protein
MNTNQNDILQILKDYKKICVIGLSPDSSKPSQSVPLYMRNHGYEIVGVNPTCDSEINGIKIYKTFSDVPLEFRKFVDVFRRNEAIPSVVDDVLAAGGTEVLWLQLGITHADAEKRAEEAGLKVVSNRCLLIEHRKL